MKVYHGYVRLGSAQEMRGQVGQERTWPTLSEIDFSHSEVN